IAMLDAGFYHYTTLTAFDSIRLNNQVVGVRDFVDFDNSVTEDDAHGMECLSTIAANIPGTMIGTAPKASFWLLRSENALSEYPIEEHNWVTAAEFADSAGADMITSSLGYYVFDDASFNHTYADFYRNTTMVSKGAAYAVKKGMIVTNSAGNEGSNGWKYIIFPADADSVCTVGATDTAGNIADFSSYGYPGKIKPDIVSAGYATTVFGTGGTPVIGYGTSFSNPNINGLIACLWQAFPQYNNMTILDAVYKSSSKYQTPDYRYGYGIPNLRKAYLILKQKQNNSLYGSNWLFAAPNPFTDTIHVTLIGQVDGPAVLTLKNSAGIIITSLKLTTEEGEVYEAVFKNLAGQPGGNYTLAYTDSFTTASLPLYKNGATVNWLLAYPSPFSNLLTVYLNAPETGTAFIRLIDVNGKILASKQVSIVQNNSYSIQFANTAALAKGIYFIQYRGVVKRTIKVIK
ncbi:MAG TPA: S8 family serine peptidase, partial [Chitinophagaceae bacterium]|nr:S8 family serine peptidase [Chitinophagaceae bacterium]